MAMLLLGGIPAYLMYIKRSVDPKNLVDRNPVLSGLSKFFWNRWYINRVYYKLFVDYLINFSRKTYQFFETGVIDRALNSLFPGGVAGFYNKFKRLQTGVLSYNVIAVIFAFLFMILMLMIFGGI